jgi:hypothetical protein
VSQSDESAANEKKPLASISKAAAPSPKAKADNLSLPSLDALNSSKLNSTKFPKQAGEKSPKAETKRQAASLESELGLEDDEPYDELESAEAAENKKGYLSKVVATHIRSGSGDLCAGCFDPSPTLEVEALSKKYHNSCLKCSSCQSKLTDFSEGFEIHNNKPYCAPCGSLVEIARQKLRRQKKQKKKELKKAASLTKDGEEDSPTKLYAELSLFFPYFLIFALI